MLTRTDKQCTDCHRHFSRLLESDLCSHHTAALQRATVIYDQLAKMTIQMKDNAIKKTLEIQLKDFLEEINPGMPRK